MGKKHGFIKQASMMTFEFAGREISQKGTREYIITQDIKFVSDV